MNNTPVSSSHPNDDHHNHHEKNYYHTRNIIDIKVGKSHSIQIQLHLRINDVSWFNSNSQTYMNQLCQLLSKDILPLECKVDIEKDYSVKSRDETTNSITNNVITAIHKKTDKNDNNQPNNNNNNDNDKNNNNNNEIITIEKEKTSKRKKQQLQQPKVYTKKARTLSKQHNNNNKKSKKNIKSLNNNKNDNGDNIHDDTFLNTTLLSSKFNSENTFLFGKDIQIVYKCIAVSTMHSCMLNYKNTTSSNTTKEGKVKLSTFEYLKPIPKRIIIWLYPFDIDNPHELNIVSAQQCFPRAELIPISNLYREKEEL